MSEYGFNILWSDEDNGFIATCADFPGLSAFGETTDEALAEANIALELFIATLEETGKEVPEPTKVPQHSGQVRLRMPKSLHGSLIQKARNEGVSLNTWIVTLLAERNATATLADTVCSQIRSVKEAIHDHHEKTKQFRINLTTAYNQPQNTGIPYGNVTARVN